MSEQMKFLIEYSGLQQSTIENSFKWVVSAMEEYHKHITESTTSVSAIEDGWVNVEDKLPEEEEWVLVYNNLEENCAVTTGVFVKGRWGILELGVDAEINVTHWRPLPPPPSNR